MRVLHINSARYWAGGEVHTFLLCNELKKLGCEIILVCRPNSPIAKISKKNGLSVINLLLLNSIDVISMIQLAFICWFKKIDIIHVHIARDTWIAYGAKILCPRVKIVFTRHVLYKLKNKRFHKYLYKNIERIIAVSEAVKEVIVKRNIYPESQINVIYNGIDLEPFKNADSELIKKEFNVSPSDKLVGIVGRLASDKGQITFIKAIPNVLSKYPSAKFLIVGEDYEQGAFKNKLIALSEELGISNNLIFTGFRSDVPQIMKALDIFVLASSSEPFGLVIIEAMAAGVPVIATKSGGAKEIIIDNKNGLLIEPHKPEELCSAITKVLSNNELTKNLIIEGKNRAEQFRTPIMTDKTYQLYKDLIQ